MLDAIRSGWVTTGPKVRALQDALAEYLGAPFVRCLARAPRRCTLALRVLGVGPRRRGAGAGADVRLLRERGRARRRATRCSSTASPRPASSTSRRASAGHPAHRGADARPPRRAPGRPRRRRRVPRPPRRRRDRGRRARDRRGLGRPAHRGHGNLTAFSFHATKNMTTFEGGALAIADEEAAERVERLALHGLTPLRLVAPRRRARPPSTTCRSRASRSRCTTSPPRSASTSSRASTADRAPGRAGRAVRRAARRTAAGAAAARARACAARAPPVHRAPGRPAPASTGTTLAHALRVRNIGTTVHFRALHLHCYYRDRCGLDPADLPVAPTGRSGRSRCRCSRR